MPTHDVDKIAIVIPAYKDVFLRRTLSSIAAQTCRDFVVYVGDDCSTYDIKSTVDEFSDAMDIRYTRFESNMGGCDLVSQWERCIALTGGEKWIWLFSDDDLMPADGVDRIKAAVKVNPASEFFRLPLQVVDENDATIRTPRRFDAALSTAEQYVLDFFRGLHSSSTCEYVFSRRLFETLGMVHFPCAWCADIATWYSYALKNGGMTNVAGAPASWRNVDGVNISSTAGMYKQKMEAMIEFTVWFRERHGLPFSRDLRSAFRIYLGTMLSLSLNFNYSKEDLRRLVREFRPISGAGAVKLYCKYLFKSKI